MRDNPLHTICHFYERLMDAVHIGYLVFGNI